MRGARAGLPEIIAVALVMALAACDERPQPPPQPPHKAPVPHLDDRPPGSAQPEAPRDRPSRDLSRDRP